MKLLIMILILFFMIGCSQDSSSNETQTNSTNPKNDNEQKTDTNENNKVYEAIDPKYFGQWRYIDSGEELLIFKNTPIEFTEKHRDLLEVREDNNRRFLIRSSVSNANITGQLVINDGNTLKTLQNYSGIGGIDVIISNITGQTISATTQTDSQGIFEDSSQPSQTTIAITASVNDQTFRTEVPINNANVDLGTFVLRDIDDYNFKASLEVEDEFIFSDGQVKDTKLIIKNIGNIEGTDVSYQIMNRDIEIARGISGTISSGASKSIDIPFTATRITTQESKEEFQIIMNDSNGRSWSDSAFLNIYRAEFTIEPSEERGKYSFIETEIKKLIKINNSLL